MHFAARALLLTKDITPKTHKGLIAKFGLEFIDHGFIELLIRQVYPATTTLRRNGGREVFIPAATYIYAV